MREEERRRGKGREERDGVERGRGDEGEEHTEKRRRT